MHIFEKLPSRLEMIPPLVQAVIEKLEKSGLSKEKLFDVKLCLDEALVNAVKHGNKFSPEHHVEVEAEITGDSLIIQVRDRGQGFDYTKIPNPTEKSNLEKNHGRGVFLIKTLMDKVEHFDSGRTIKMVKFIKNGGKK
ncbi:MAG: ATP-binding protein [Candidatus Omnitrophica bacterium]|nr:ATP-binding protein [Candidatus Omnitrophota bacterium]